MECLFVSFNKKMFNILRIKLVLFDSIFEFESFGMSDYRVQLEGTPMYASYKREPYNGLG